MTAKEYLSQAHRLDQRIDAKIAQVASLNDLATKCTATLTGMPRNPNNGGSTMADAVCKIIDLQEEINRDIDRLVDLKREIVEVIKAVEDTEYQILLEKRYFPQGICRCGFLFVRLLYLEKAVPGSGPLSLPVAARAGSVRVEEERQAPVVHRAQRIHHLGI